MYTTKSNAPVYCVYSMNVTELGKEKKNKQTIFSVSPTKHPGRNE
jgi:hypothetical protein